MPVGGIRGRRSLGDAISGTIVPLQTELSGSDPRQAYHKVLVVTQILMNLHCLDTGKDKHGKVKQSTGHNRDHKEI